MKKAYKEMTEAERKNEIRLLKKDIKKITLPLKDIEEHLVYLEYLGAVDKLKPKKKKVNKSQ